MSVKIADLFRDLAKKAGITDVDSNPAFSDLLANTTEVPQEAANAIQTKLITIDAAKANKEIIAQLKADALDGVDKELARFMEDFKFDDATKALIDAEKSSYRRIPLVLNKTKELAQAKLQKELEELKAKKGGDNAEEIATLQGKINDLNSQIGTVKKDHDDQLSKLRDQHGQELVGLEINNHLAGLKYIFPDTMDKAAQIAAARAILDPELKSKDLIVVQDGAALVLKKSDGTDYFDEKSNKVSFKDLVNKTFADKELLYVSDPNRGPGGGGGGGSHKEPGAPGGGGSKVDPSIMAQLEADAKTAGELPPVN